MMELQEAVRALEEPASRINGGVNAIGAMALGLLMARDPYADGLNAVWNYIFDANQDIQDRIQTCLNLI